MLNITCALIISSFAIWTIADPYLISKDFTKETVVLFQNISSFGWISFGSLFVCFSLAFSKRKELLNNKLALVLIFILPLILLFVQWTEGLNSTPVLGSVGWEFGWKETFWTYLFYAYYISFMLIGIYIISRYGIQTKNISEKKQSRIIVITVTICLICISITDIIVPLLDFHAFPQIGKVILLVFAGGIIYAIVKYEFLTVSFAIAIAAENIISTMDELLILTDVEGKIINVNNAVTDSLKYEQKELTGQSVALLFSENSLLTNLFGKITTGETVRSYDANLLSKDACEIPVIFSGSSLKDKRGDVRGMVFIATNIAERKRVEETLRESEEMYHFLVESIPDWIWEVDTKGIYTYASPSVINILGYAPEEMIGQSPFDLMPEDERQRIGAIFAGIFAKKQPIVALENVNRHRDGRLIVLETSGNPILGHNGELLGYRGIDRDITVRKQMEEDLRESERLLLESQEIASLGSFSWNISKGLWTSSKILDRIFGIDESYVRSFEGWQAIINPNFRETMQNYIVDEVLGKQQKFDKEYQIINQENGQERWVHGLGQLELDSNHLPIKLIGTIQDITERKLSEETINNSKSKLSLALKIARLGAWEYDVANDLFTFNDSFYAIFRTNADQVGRNTMSSADYANRFVYPEDLSKVGDEIRMSNETDNPDYCHQLEHRIIYADGEIGYMAVRLAIVKDKNGKTVKVFGINQDITERKCAEDSLRINVKRLQELNALQFRLQYPSTIEEKLKLITETVVQILDADFARIWMIKPGDHCNDGCVHAQATEAEHICRFREQCLHLMASSGRYTHIDGEVHARVPFGCYKIGKIAAAVKDNKFLTNKVTTDPRVHNNAWAKELGLVSFAGYRLGDTTSKPLGVLALFSKQAISSEDDSFLELIAHSTSWVLHSEWDKTFMRESEEKLSSLFASMTEMVATHELVFNEKDEAINYRITDCNNAFTTITGIKKENAIGKLVTEVYQTDTPPHLDELAQVALTGSPFEFTEYSNDIDKYLMFSVISPKKNQFSTIATDITVIQQIQNEIKDKNKELENYLYIASHDLRSPLVNIQGFSQRFLKQSDAIKNVLEKCQIETETKQGLDKITNEDIPKTLNFILTNVTKMENLINGLLQISRTGRVVMTIRKVDMNRLIRTIVASHNFQITELSAKVIINDLPDCYGDENLLNQLFSNIISNALKYRDPSRQLVIEIASRTQFNKLIYSIKDSGIGIESRHLEKIWDVFYRVDPGSDVAGEGIGLSLSRRITDKHKGKIWVESEIGKGSVFYVELQRNEFSE